MEKSKKQKNKFNEKVILLYTLIIIVLTILILIVIPSIRASNLAFLSYRFYCMGTRYQDNIAIKGDLIIAKETKLEDLKPGDRIVYNNNKNKYFADELTQVFECNENSIIVKVQDSDAKYKYTNKEVKGTVIKTIPDLGSLVLFFRTILGFIFFALITICIYLLLRVILLYNTNDDNSEENKGENA